MSKSLKEFLIECKDAYYAGNPIISDEQYDHLEEICNEDLSVGTNRGRTRHWFRMYSLQKFYYGEDFPVWKIGYKLEDEVDTPKLDGAAVAIRYLNGEFHSVVTRGNGEYGEDVSHLFQDVKTLESMSIPPKLYLPITVQVVGEVVAPKYIENARNYAAGALSLKDPTEFWTKEITFIAYDMLPYDTESYSDTLALCRRLGFYTIDDDSITEDFPQDGRVVRVDCNARYIHEGFTSKHPRGAFAVKERTEGVKTKILDVIWQTGKSGKVTPVAILEPVEIDGATVSRATLNNFGFIAALGVQIGDSVFVERAGGIIPRIIRKAE
jgi:DNA ligase (NAD+)